jgi:hypothetical protein
MAMIQKEIGQSDPLIDEIRAIRKEIAAQFGNDIDRLCDHLQVIENQSPQRVVQPPVAAKDSALPRQ